MKLAAKRRFLVQFQQAHAVEDESAIHLTATESLHRDKRRKEPGTVIVAGHVFDARRNPPLSELPAAMAMCPKEG
jgi:hypothetical protein